MYSVRTVWRTTYRILLVAAVLLLGTAGASAKTPSVFGPGVMWHYDRLASNENLVLVRSVVGDPAVDSTGTHVVSIDGYPSVDTSGWQTLDLRPYGVPATAKYISVGVKTIITKGDSSGAADVFLFARSPGALCCQGPPGYESDPMPFNAGQHVRGMVAQAVDQLPGDGVRNFTHTVLPVLNGRLEWSWGYTRNPGLWPVGDGVAVNLYLNGWAG